MSLKLKALGLSALAVVALSAFAVMNASAEVDVKGHFVSDSLTGNTNITGIEQGVHDTKLVVGTLKAITCFNNKYEGTVTTNTVQSITITPKYTDCRTEGSATVNETPVHTNGCTYTFTISKNSEGTQNTADLVCPGPNKNIVITHPSCEMTIPAQTNIAGLTYKTLSENLKHTITLTTAAKFTTHFHAGACVLLGTVKVGELQGSVTVEGYQDNGVGQPHGPRVNITATGSVG